MGAGGVVTVREVLTLLRPWQPRLLAGAGGLGRAVTWAGMMRPHTPAFEDFTGGELVLVSLSTLRLLHAQVDFLTLAALMDELAGLGASAVALVGTDEAEPDELAQAQARADSHTFPLLELPSGTPLAAIERAVIEYVFAQRQRQRPASPPEPPTESADHLRATLRGEVLEALLTGTYAGETQMRARAAQLGYDLAQAHAILWIDLAPRAEGLSRDGHRRVAAEARPLAEALGVALGAWTRVRGAEVVALLPLPAEGDTRELVERVQALLARTLGEHAPEWAAGLGEPATAPAEVRRSTEEARAAERLGLDVLGPRRIARPAELGVYRLLLALRESDHLEPFVERTLAPLRADRRAGDLVATLEAFFACNGNLSEAARRLHLHRNSLLYRLHRARELLVHDLDDPELRLALQLAIKGQRVLDLG